jgi:FixJ family two-component response regulator
MSRLAPIVAVVDDDLSVRRGMERLLRSGGYQVRTFASAAEFRASDRVEPIACLVLDVRMPGASGLDLQEMLRTDERDLPIVFISGHGDIAVVVRAMKGGAVDFLAKPFEDQELFGAIEQAIARRGGGQAAARV